MMHKSYKKSYKNIIHRYDREFRKSSYFIDCNYLPAEAIEINLNFRFPYESDVSGVNCLGDPVCCSLIYCQPCLISKDTYTILSEFIKNHSKEEYFQKYLGKNGYLFPYKDVFIKS